MPNPITIVNDVLYLLSNGDGTYRTENPEGKTAGFAYFSLVEAEYNENGTLKDKFYHKPVVISASDVVPYRASVLSQASISGQQLLDFAYITDTMYIDSNLVTVDYQVAKTILPTVASPNTFAIGETIESANFVTAIVLDNTGLDLIVSNPSGVFVQGDTITGQTTLVPTTINADPYASVATIVNTINEQVSIQLGVAYTFVARAISDSRFTIESPLPENSGRHLQLRHEH